LSLQDVRAIDASRRDFDHPSPGPIVGTGRSTEYEHFGSAWMSDFNSQHEPQAFSNAARVVVGSITSP
jgi:hypothetical protein